MSVAARRPFGGSPMSDDAVWLAVIELTQMVTELGDLVLAKKPDASTYRKKRNGHLKALNQLLEQHAKVGDAFHNRLVDLEESEARRQADKDRPLEITIVREGAAE